MKSSVPGMEYIFFKEGQQIYFENGLQAEVVAQ